MVGNYSTFHSFSNKLTINLYKLCLLVKHMLRINMNCCLIVTIHGYRQLHIKSNSMRRYLI